MKKVEAPKKQRAGCSDTDCGNCGNDAFSAVFTC